MTIYRVTNKEGKEISPGDEVTDFRGDTRIFEGVGRAPDFGRSGKVYVRGRLGWFNDSVFGLSIARRVEDVVAGRAWLRRYLSPDLAEVEYDDGQVHHVRVSELIETEEL